MNSVFPDAIRVLSFDPGTTNMGWAISEYHVSNGQFVVHNQGLFKSSKIAKKRKEDVEHFGQRFVSLSVVTEETQRLLLSYQPHFVCTEDTFFNPRTPQAHVALLLCIHTVELVLYRNFCDNRLHHPTARKIYKLAPMTIKMMTTGKGNSDKEGITDAIRNEDRIQFNNQRKEDVMESMIEHVSDAIACGWSFVKTELIQLLNQ